jgi:HEPN domain-containing protein
VRHLASNVSEPSVDSWFAAARDALADSERLAAGHSWRNAYGLAGQAVELALKGVIMRRLGLNRWPSRQERREFYVHDLMALAELGQCRAELETAIAEGETVGTAWMLVKDYDINRRYPDHRPFPIKLGRDMVQAVGRDGLLEWLIAPKTTR